jgi:mannose/cellobiose epimerase-like protein (N-acyl-D-glucosamine 2-epimerase family)
MKAFDLKSWAKNEALPLWATTGWDAKRGGFHEKLTLEGKPDLHAIRRLRVQARQIYVYAHAASLGWYDDGLRIALGGFEYLMDKGHAPDGAPGFVHLLKPDGQVENALRDSYDHMFVVLALAWLVKVSGDAQIRTILDQTIAFVDAELTDQNGMLFEGKPRSLPRRQNPNMHAFEAQMALHETLGYPGALQRAETFLNHFKQHFVDPKTGMILEFFNEDWRPLPPPKGTSVEPGHLAEWTWLIRRYEVLAGKPASAFASQFLDRAVSTADPTTGLLFDEADVMGIIRKKTSRTWPHTEVVKAWLAEAEIGREGARAKAVKALENLHLWYMKSCPKGGWIDQRDAGGKVISDHIPASTFYHFFVAAVEADRVLSAL